MSRAFALATVRRDCGFALTTVRRDSGLALTTVRRDSGLALATVRCNAVRVRFESFALATPAVHQEGDPGADSRGRRRRLRRENEGRHCKRLR